MTPTPMDGLVKHNGGRPRLRVISTHEPRVTGEQVLIEGAELLVDLFSRRLPELALDDPCREEIALLAQRHRAVADRGA